MSKRFTETDKWKDPWFRGLQPPHKLIFIYIIDNCNNAGFYELDAAMMEFQIGLKSCSIEGALKGLERGLVEVEGWVWVKNFLRHQKNESLNPENPAHKQIINLLKDQFMRFERNSGFLNSIAPYKGLICPIGTSNGTGKGEGESAERGFHGVPSEAEFLSACHNAGIAEWYAREQFHAKNEKGWGRGNWRSHVTRVKAWFLNDGMPTERPKRNGQRDPQGAPAPPSASSVI